MPEEQKVPISSFPEASSIDGADTVTGLQNNVNTNFKFSTILAWLVNAFRSAFVPAGRTVNNKSLASDITLSASDVGARPDNWTPPAADVTYDNTGSGLSASDVQDALDELAAGAGGSTAASTSYDNTGSGLAATNAQDAIDELSDEKADQITVAPVETSTTASEAHGLGSVFYLGGKLYRALADIAIGGTINTAAGGNATETSIAQNFKRTVTLTSAQFAQLSAAEKAADILYIITDEPAPSAYTSNPEMDGTASPGSSEAWARGDHVHPSDTSKANQAQLAYVENGTTASRAYAVGEYFCWNGLLYRAKTAISSGGTFTPGTNCEQTTVGDELAGRVYIIFSPASLLDVHSGATIPIATNAPVLDKYKFVVLRLTTSSSDSSSSRGVVMVPVTAIRTGPYIPAVVGGVSGWLRISASSDYKSFVITSTSFTSLYLVNIYGII